MRYHIPRLFLLGLLAFVAEITIVCTFPILGARTELLLALAVTAALFARDARQAAGACWMLGLLKDLGSSGPPGLNALAFVLVGATLFKLRIILAREHPFTQATVAFASAFFISFADALSVMVQGASLSFGRAIGGSLHDALPSALLLPILISLLRARPWFLRPVLSR